jgi:hypothetical protein
MDQLHLLQNRRLATLPRTYQVDRLISRNLTNELGRSTDADSAWSTHRAAATSPPLTYASRPALLTARSRDAALCRRRLRWRPYTWL